VALIRIFARNQETFTPTERRVANALRPFKRLYHYLRHNSPAGSRRNIAAHYDLGEQFYALFLDPTMTYSCGIFPSSDATLEEASREKLDRICRKLELGPEDHVLEIGTGWGSFAQHAAEVYGCRVTTTTISKRQHEYATRRMAARGLEGRVTVLSTDYRQLTGVYDKLVAIEMIEAVGHRYLPTFLATCERLLKPEGLAALQAITIAEEHYERYRRSVDFIQHYVFPGSCLISMDHFRESLKRSTRLDLAGCEDITPHYARTLRAWRERFMARREEVHALGFPEPFLRLWEYYLAYCEAGFLEERIGDVQLLLAGPARSPSGSAAPGDEARSAC
jgi:cyclopropane-fatty-acyl-phospholipid synthase